MVLFLHQPEPEQLAEIQGVSSKPEGMKSDRYLLKNTFNHHYDILALSFQFLTPSSFLIAICQTPWPLHLDQCLSAVMHSDTRTHSVHAKVWHDAGKTQIAVKSLGQGDTKHSSHNRANKSTEVWL